METIRHFMVLLYTSYRDELMLALLACVFLLMIFALAAVRRCRRQIKELTEKTREMTKAVLSQGSRSSGRGSEESRARVKTGEGTYAAASRQNEELFGSVIQEIFP